MIQTTPRRRKQERWSSFDPTSNARLVNAKQAYILRETTPTHSTIETQTLRDRDRGPMSVHQRTSGAWTVLLFYHMLRPRPWPSASYKRTLQESFAPRHALAPIEIAPSTTVFTSIVDEIYSDEDRPPVPRTKKRAPLRLRLDRSCLFLHHFVEMSEYVQTANGVLRLSIC